MDYCLLCKNSLHLTNKIKKIWSVRLLQISNNVLYKRFTFDEVLFYEYIELFKFCIHYNASLDVPSQVFVQYWFYVKVWYIEVKAIDISITFGIQNSFYSNMILNMTYVEYALTVSKQILHTGNNKVFPQHMYYSYIGIKSTLPAVL